MFIQDLKHKAECFYGESSLKHILRIMLVDGTSAVFHYRCARFFQKIGLGFIGWFLLDWNRFANGCVIGRNAEFGKGFVIMHPAGVVINGGVKGGENIVIESGVVVGAARNGLPVEVPELGSNIFIGSGAKILGCIKIGNNVKIGANSVVIKDVPDGATVVGVPGRIIEDRV